MRMNIQQQRTEIVERFINIETLINASISQYFFKRVDTNFFFLVLFDAHFSYNLRIRIFEKIVDNLPKYTYKVGSKKVIEYLHRIGTIRNYFIHIGGFEFFPSKDGRENIVLTKSLIAKEGVTPDPNNPAKTLNFTELYNEYLVIEQSLTKELDVIYKALGGAYVK